MELFVNIERVSISTRGAASCPKCHKLSSECTQPMKLQEKRPSPVRHVVIGCVKAGRVGAGANICLSIESVNLLKPFDAGGLK